MLRLLLRTRTDWTHMLVVNMIAWFLSYEIIIDIMSHIVWGDSFEGAMPQGFIGWKILHVASPLIVLYPFSIYGMRTDYKKGKWEKAKSYMVSFLIILLGALQAGWQFYSGKSRIFMP